MREGFLPIDGYDLGLLAQSQILRGFSIKEIKNIFKDNKNVRTREYDPGEFIIRQNQIDCWISILNEGQVAVVKDNFGVCIISRKGDVFGEIGAIEGQPRTADVIALKSTSCLEIDMSIMDRLTPDQKDRLMDNYKTISVGRLVTTTTLLSELLGKNKKLKEEIDQLKKRLHDLETKTS